MSLTRAQIREQDAVPCLVLTHLWGPSTSVPPAYLHKQI